MEYSDKWTTIGSVAASRGNAIGLVALGVLNAFGMAAMGVLNALGLVALGGVNAVGLVAISAVNAVGFVAIGGVNAVGVVAISGHSATGLIAISPVVAPRASSPRRNRQRRTAFRTYESGDPSVIERRQTIDRAGTRWAREDSNLHELNAHWVLNPARLPIPPLARPPHSTRHSVT